MIRTLAFLLLPLTIALTGCEERYRYPCQDPDNWNKKECTKPFCSANGTCPEDLTHYEKNTKPGAPQAPGLIPPKPINGGCNKC